MDLTAGGDELGELFLLFAQRDPLLDESQRAERSTHYAEQAVALLRESQEKGLPNMQEVETNLDFEPLRTWDCYRRLID